jgi:hypothetical protein
MRNDDTDPYWRLRPASATSEDEVCRCPRGGGIMLRDGLTDNPLLCVACNGEVPPERVGFGAKLAEEIASWLSVYDSLYRLWLDSAEYEAWASARLSDPRGQVNVQGREIVEKLNAITPAYYWWFEDTDGAEAERLKVCPICTRALGSYQNRNHRVCETCRILV